MLAAGYATIPAVYDDGTGRLSGAGGDGLLIAAAREWAWALPVLGTARGDAALAIDFGLSRAHAIEAVIAKRRTVWRR